MKSLTTVLFLALSLLCVTARAEPPISIHQPSLPAQSERDLPIFESPREYTDKLIAEGKLRPGSKHRVGEEICYDADGLNLIAIQLELFPSLSMERADAAWKRGWVNAAQSYGLELDKTYVWGMQEHARADAEKLRADTLASTKSDGWPTTAVVIAVVSSVVATALGTVWVTSFTP